MAWIEIAVVALVALVVVLAVLVIRERKARQRFRILGEIATVSDAGGSLEETFEAICAILVPGIADFCMMDVIDDGRMARGAGVRAGAQGCGCRGAPCLYERMSEHDLRGLARDEEDLEFLRGLGMRSAITVALQARGEVTGALTIAVAWSRRRYRRSDSHFAWILSGRIALALDNSGLLDDLLRPARGPAAIAETLPR